MQAVILYDLNGDPDGTEIESKLDGDFPAIDANTTRYLDGQTLQHGEAAARIEETQQLPMVGHDGIETEEMERSRRALVEWFADLEDGWAGISSQDGEWFVQEWLDVKHRVRGEPLELNLEAWIDDFLEATQPSIWGLTYSVDVGDETTRAGSQFHNDADLSQLERDAEDVSGVGFRYKWDGSAWTRGVIFESGYVAVYRDWDEAMFGRWLAAHVLPYATYSAEHASNSVQSTLGETTDATTDTAAEEVED